MELYHIHLLGNHDRLYKENTEFVVDKTKFNNRMYNRVYNMNATVDVKNYKRIMDHVNYLCRLNGIREFDNRINLGEIVTYILHEKYTQEELKTILNDAKGILLDEDINLREMAMEEYRKNNCPELPSRMHSLYACQEEGVEFWKTKLYDNDSDIYRIDIIDEPFLSNEQLLPIEDLSYGEKIKASYQYFHPRKKDLNPITNEYLVQGKVKILEKIDEVRRKNIV